MSDSAKFDASLPSTYSENWRQAYRVENSDSPRMAYYQAPGGNGIRFIQKSFEFSGGNSKDTAEYPFGGLWSNEWLNEKPQVLVVKGFLRGANYIARRNALIEALRVPTSDDNPGYIDFPFWGRFPVVVDDYHVAEDTDAQGQCEVRLTLTRAGVMITGRFAAKQTSANVDSAVNDLLDTAADDFEEKLSKTNDSASLASGFSKMKDRLLSAVNKVRNGLLLAASAVARVKTAINTVTNTISGIQNLIAEGIRAPRELANALKNAVNAVIAGFAEIKNAFDFLTGEDGNASGSGDGAVSSQAYPQPEADYEKNLLLQFLSESGYTTDVPAVTVAQETTKRAMDNLYRTMAFAVSAQVLASMSGLTFQAASGYWNLLTKLGESIDQDNPAVHTALTNVRIAVSMELSGRELSAEKRKDFSHSLPLLYLAHYLGCDDDALRRLNAIADSFVIEGNIIYV